MKQYTPIAEAPDYIVLDQYTPVARSGDHYQSEAELERELIADLVAQGYEYAPEIKTPALLLANVRRQLEALNGIHFGEAEWQRFVDEYLDKPGEDAVAKARKLHDDYIYDFVYDDGHLGNIRLVDKQDQRRNKLQVISQLEQTGLRTNRYDVTILVNGLPLVHLELKRRGVAIREAFNQIHRYSRESFHGESSLYRYVQLFVISNGTDTRYFAATTRREKSSYDFTMNWALVDNQPIKELRDFTATFLGQRTLLSLLLTYTVLDTKDTLLVMRPYQVAATERILSKVRNAWLQKAWSTPKAGGYVWHTTGSGKTLTSFKAAQLATQLDFVDKVFFVVDRKDLDYQTMLEYQRFSPDSVNGSDSTRGLKLNIERTDRKIIVTTIQKLTRLLRGEAELPVYEQQVVLIFDEAHRSQFGEAQQLIQTRFRYYYQFGFTGTPIFKENAVEDQTTELVFGPCLHRYILPDAIRDEKVLKFKVDYNDVRPAFRDLERASPEEVDALPGANVGLRSPERIRQICRYILEQYPRKTHRQVSGRGGFNAMLTVDSIDSLRVYYDELQQLQQGLAQPLRVATIFSVQPNEPVQPKGSIADEGADPELLELSNREFLARAIKDYNGYFGTNYRLDSTSFQNYYRDLAKRTRAGEVDLLLVVGMFLTGFDAPCLNTLFVDKPLCYHGLIQAFSRTNRIYNETKAFGNIVCFRDLEEATNEALRLFSDSLGKETTLLLELGYGDYMHGYEDASGTFQPGYQQLLGELRSSFPDPKAIVGEQAEYDFVVLFGAYLRMEHRLRNYDQYTACRELEALQPEDTEGRARIQERYGLSEEELQELVETELLSHRDTQDYRSTYQDLIRKPRPATPSSGGEEGDTPSTVSAVDWSGVTFEIELLKSQEITLDYLLSLLFDYYKEKKSKEGLIEELRRVVRASVEHRAKEGLITDFIQEQDLDSIPDKETLVRAFYAYARERKEQEVEELISEEGLRPQEARRYIAAALHQEYASDLGTDFSEILPPAPLVKNPGYLQRLRRIFERVERLVDTYKQIGGELLDPSALDPEDE